MTPVRHGGTAYKAGMVCAAKTMCHRSSDVCSPSSPARSPKPLWDRHVILGSQADAKVREKCGNFVRCAVLNISYAELRYDHSRSVAAGVRPASTVINAITYIAGGRSIREVDYKTRRDYTIHER
jgi:hypothetical protein